MFFVNSFEKSLLLTRTKRIEVFNGIVDILQVPGFGSDALYFASSVKLDPVLGVLVWVSKAFFAAYPFFSEFIDGVLDILLRRRAYPLLGRRGCDGPEPP